MTFLILVPLGLQGMLMAIDEIVCHQKRSLPTWERIGHPLDTLSVLVCWLVADLFQYSDTTLKVYVCLSVFSCIFITKDEFVHSEKCSAFEHWLHSLLFVLHPLCLIAVGVLWSHGGAKEWILAIVVMTAGFLVYQIYEWNIRPRTIHKVDNSLYHDLHERWYLAEDDPVALLRTESKLRNPWVRSLIREKHADANVAILDIGCGGGFLSNALALDHHQVTGLDLSATSLAVAHDHDPTHSVQYLLGDALHLPFDNSSFDVVTCMDFLEHVEDPQAVIREAARVLRPGGVFFFHTFNRNGFSKFLIIKCVEWFVKNTPDHLHVIHLFVKPSELKKYCLAEDLHVQKIYGVRPVLWNRSVLTLLLTGKVSKDFTFKFWKFPLAAYSGYATKGRGGKVSIPSNLPYLEVYTPKSY